MATATAPTGPAPGTRAAKRRLRAVLDYLREDEENLRQTIRTVERLIKTDGDPSKLPGLAANHYGWLFE